MFRDELVPPPIKFTQLDKDDPAANPTFNGTKHELIWEQLLAVLGKSLSNGK